MASPHDATKVAGGIHSPVSSHGGITILTGRVGHDPPYVTISLKLIFGHRLFPPREGMAIKK